MTFIGEIYGKTFSMLSIIYQTIVLCKTQAAL